MKYDLEYVLDSALDGVFIVASDHRLVLFNRACEELYGISRQDVVDKACWKLATGFWTLYCSHLQGLPYTSIWV